MRQAISEDRHGVAHFGLCRSCPQLFARNSVRWGAPRRRGAVTSQGCSSCPPANAFLNEMSRGRSDVLPLAFHVTYWDRLGWKDPFSLEAATVRQDHYGHRFGDGSYTPEMVVDEMVGLVGSHRDEVNAAIERAKRGQHTAADVIGRELAPAGCAGRTAACRPAGASRAARHPASPLVGHRPG